MYMMTIQLDIRRLGLAVIADPRLERVMQEPLPTKLADKRHLNPGKLALPWSDRARPADRRGPPQRR